MALKLLLDTNVWLDYFIDRSAMHDRTRELVVSCSLANVPLFASVGSAKDCFFLIGQELKRMERAQAGSVSESAANAIREVAWTCTASMRKLAYMVPGDDGDMIEALIMRSSHEDFEDNLVIAAAKRSQADYVVTSDKALIAHYPATCIAIDDALRLVAEL